MTNLMLGHSIIARRQYSFCVTMQKYMDLVFCPPKTWGKHIYNGPSTTMAQYKTEGGIFYYTHGKEWLKQVIEENDPEWILSFIEPYSFAAKEILEVIKGTDIKFQAFAYENLSHNLISLPPTVKQMLKKQAKEIDLVICGNYRALQFMNYYQAKTAQIPHCGIETDLFVPTMKETLNMGVFVGRDVPEKNWELIKKMQDIDQHLIVYRPTHFMKDEEFPSVYHKAKVLIHPSLKIDTWKEQLGYVIPEALSCGLSVIQSIEGDNIEYFTGVPGVYNGDPTDENQYLELFYEALNDYPNMKGRKWVVENFSNDVIAKRWLEAIK